MKMKFKRISKSTLSVILAMMMLVSTSLVGSFTTTAATVDDNSVGTNNRFDQGETLYLDVTKYFDYNGSQITWEDSSATFKAEFYYYDNSNSLHSTELPTKVTDGIYSFTVPNNEYLGYVNFKRFDSNGNNEWASTGNISVDDFRAQGANAAQITGLNKSFTLYSYNSTGGTYFTTGETLYLDTTNAVYNITLEGAKPYIKFWKDSTSSFAWRELTPSGNNVYSTTVPNGEWDKLVYCRVKSNFNASVNWDESTLWKYTVTQTPADKGTNNCWEMTGGDMNGKWSIYSGESQTYTLTFGSNGGTYGTVTATDDSGNTVSSGKIASGTKVTFTATPKTGYKVGGWYSDRTFSNKIDGTSNETTYTATITANTNVYVKFVEDSVENVTYKVYAADGSTIYDMFEDPNNSGIYYSSQLIQKIWWFKVQKTVGDSVTYSKSNSNGAQVLQGDPVKVQAWDTNSATNSFAYDNQFNADSACLVYDSNTDYVYFVATVPSTGGGGDSTWILYDGMDSDNNKNTNLGAFSTTTDSSIFELPCELTKGQEYHLYIYNNSANGKYWRMGDSAKFDDANLSQDLVPYGNNVPDHYISFTPEVTGTYTFTWVDNGDRGTLSVAYPEDSSPHTVIFGMNDDTLGSVTATNTVTGENISSSSSVPSGTSVKFTARPNEGYKVEGWYSDIDCTNLISGTTNAKSYTKVIRTDANVYVKFVERVPISTTIYAKNCTYNVDNGGVVGLNYGDTILVDADGKSITPSSTDDVHKYKTYSIMSDTEVTISTTVDATHYKGGEGYYVAGFVVNGETVTVENKRPNSNGSCTYSGYYKVEDSEKIEITPVYFNKTIEDNKDYVYFTVEADDVPTNWGNTTAAYSYYYYYDVNGTRYQYEQDGAWPGQPLLKTKTGVYWTKVSKYYYDENSNKIDCDMSGVVFSNYGADYVHKEQLGFGFCQTYDYNTPVVAIANGYDTISFATRYRNNTNNLATVGSDFNPDSYKNGWDIVWDYNHSKNVDIIGNEVVDANKAPIYVVSTGPNPIDGVADYAAVWHVYAKTSNGYKKITSGLPSTFISPDSEQYEAMNTDEYKGRPTYISYEKINDNRIDGRWHYSKQAELEIPVYLQAQYKNSEGKWVYDNEGIAGTATIDGVAPDERGISSKTFHIGEEASILADNKDGYVFEGWYLVDTQSSENTNDFTFTRLDTITRPSEDIIINRSMYLVARFEPIPEGELALSHNPFPKSGLGYYSIKAVVRDSDGSVKGTYESSSSVSFPITANDSIEITLSTRAAGINVFDGWYSDENGEYYPLATYPADENKGASFDGKVYKYIFTQKAADLFDDDKLLKNTMNFYSKITEVSSTATLNYQYDDRFGGLKTYTKTVQLSAQFLEDNGYDMDNVDGQTIIMENAPAVGDLYKDLKWEITNQTVTYSGTTVTLKAINLTKKYTLYVSNGGAPENLYDEGIKYNSLIDGDPKTEDNPHGFKIKADDTDSEGKSFSYWIVTKTDDPENREVSRTYSKYFNLRIVDNYTITAVYGKEDNKNASIDDPTYTREQYTDNGKDFDYLYADFVLSYTSKDGTIIRENPTRYNTGIILEFDKNIKITPPAVGEEVSFEGKKFDTSEDKINDAIKNIDSGKFKTYDPNGGSTNTRAIYNYKIDSSLYNNMNRVDYYLRFNNTPNFQNYVMKAYFYVVDNNTGETTISAPVYFNLYEIGNSEPNKG